MDRLIILVCFLWMYSLSAGATGPAQNSAAYPETEIYTSTYSDSLLEERQSKHNSLNAKGYAWELVYKLDLIGKALPPSRKTYVLDNLDIQLALDGKKIIGIDGSTGLLHILSNRGGKPAEESNRLPHGLDNIETPTNANTTKLYQAWIQQTFLSERLSVLLGLYDLNSEFYVTESAGIFIHPTFGIGAEMAGTGKNGPSIFPTTSLGLRLKMEPVSGYILKFVSLDGVPGDTNNPSGTHLQFNKGDGVLNVVESEVPLGLAESPRNGKWTLGVWRYTAHFNDVLDRDIDGQPIQKLSRGIYTTVEQVLQHNPITNTDGLIGFVRVGKNDGDTTQFDMAWSAGLLLQGLLSDREQDLLGIGIAQERNGSKYRQMAGNTLPVYERSLEMTYRYQVRPGIVLQPVVQYLLNHSNDPAQNKSWWLGTRLQAEL